MPKGITGADISSGITRLLGLTGKFSMSQDEIQVAVLEVAKLDRSPFQLTRPCGAGNAQGPVVAENAIISVSPSVGVILCIDRIDISPGTTGIHFIQRFTAANFVTMGAPFSITALRDFNNIEPPPPTGPRVGSVLETRSAVGVFGDRVAQYRITSSQATQVEFPAGYFLFGNDPAGINGLAVVASSLNTNVAATFFCREFRLP